MLALQHSGLDVRSIEQILQVVSPALRELTINTSDLFADLDVINRQRFPRLEKVATTSLAELSVPPALADYISKAPDCPSGTQPITFFLPPSPRNAPYKALVRQGSIIRMTDLETSGIAWGFPVYRHPQITAHMYYFWE